LRCAHAGGADSRCRQQFPEAFILSLLLPHLPSKAIAKIWTAI
jgi:hypothetical protein